MKDTSNWIIGVCIAIGLIVLGVFVNKGLQSFSQKERVVTVKGLAEKDIKAVGAKLRIDIRMSSDNPDELLKSVKNRVASVQKFLSNKGYSDLKATDIDLYDSKTYYEFRWDGEKNVQVKKDRYTCSQSITVKLSDVEKAESISKSMNIELIKENLSADISCSYDFPELNSIKPQLIAESTQNARVAGEKFAADSQSKLGKIKTASQGQISIAGTYYGEDEAISNAPEEPYIQRARVVSTIVFFLED